MKVALVGFGKMGKTVDRIATERGHHIVARLGRSDRIDSHSLADADVAVEFTTPDSAVDNLLQLCRAGVDVVVGTTGWQSQQREVFEAAAEAGIGLLHAPNLSIGVHLFYRLSTELGRLVGTFDSSVAYDVHLHEAHHRHKVDAPSGTAVWLAEALLPLLPHKRAWGGAPPDGVIDRSELLVTSTRAGEIPGTHIVAAEGEDDRIEIRHEARSRDGFARGAVTAAEWVRGRTGVFTIDDLIESMLNAGQGDDGPAAAPGSRGEKE